MAKKKSEPKNKRAQSKYLFVYEDGTSEIVTATKEGHVGGTIDKQNRAMSIRRISPKGNLKEFIRNYAAKTDAQ